MVKTFSGSEYREKVIINLLTVSFTEVYIFQQDNALSNYAHRTVQLLRHKTPEFTASAVWPPICQAVNPADYYIWGVTITAALGSVVRFL